MKNPIIQIITFKKTKPLVHMCILQALPEACYRKQVQLELKFGDPEMRETPLVTRGHSDL